MHVVFAARLHELGVTLRVGSDDDNLSLECLVDVFKHLYGVRTASLLLGVEDDVALLGDAAFDHVKEDAAERLLHVGADPDEVPVIELDAGREDRPDAGSGTDADALLVEVREVGQTGELHLAGPDVGRLVGHHLASPVSLDANDHIVSVALDALRDDSEAMVFTNWRASNTAKKTLLNATLELDDCRAVAVGGNFNWDLADGHPGDGDEKGRDKGKPELLGEDEVVSRPSPVTVDLLLTDGEADEEPDTGNCEPTSKPVVVLEDVVMSFADWWKRREDDHGDNNRGDN